MGETMVELADTLVAEADVIEFLQTLTERCVDVLRVDVVGVLLADQRGVITLMAVSDDEVSLLELFDVQQTGGPALECYRTGEAVGWTGLDSVPTPFALLAGAHGFDSVQAAPMRLHDRTIGVLVVLCGDANPPGPEVERLAQSFADMASICVPHIRSRTYQDVLAEQLRSAVHDRITVDQAKGVLAELRRTDVGEAFTAMRAWARDRRLHVVDVARAVINGDPDVAALLVRDGRG